MREWLIRQLGGHPTIEDAIDAIQENKDKYLILTYAVKRLFNTISADDILKVHESGQWTFMGRTLPKETRDIIISEANIFLESKLWDVLQKDVQYQSNKKMYLLAEKETDLIMGKSWIFVLDAMRTRLESLKKGSGVFNTR